MLIKKIVKINLILLVGILFVNGCLFAKGKVPSRQDLGDDYIFFADEAGDLLNDSFESQESADNWSVLWMREEGKVEQGYDSEGINNSRSLLIKSESEKDWSYGHNQLIEVNEGDVFNFEGFVKTKSEGGWIGANLSVILCDKDKKVIQWSYAKESVGEAPLWVNLTRRFMIPKGVKYIRFRLTGAGVGQTWFDNIRFHKEEIRIVGDGNLEQIYFLENILLHYKFDMQNGIISVFDKRVSEEWVASIGFNNFSILEVNETDSSRLDLKIIKPESMEQYKIAITLISDLAEIDYEIEQVDGGKINQLEFPPLFNIKDTMQFVVPLQEGMLIPGDFPVENFPWVLRYYGWVLSMPFIGVIDGERGWMEIVETPNDFEIGREKDKDGKLLLKNRWISEKGTFGYNRRIKYCFFDTGDYVAIAKRYRQYAKDKGLFETLKDKDVKRRGNISKLVGAVNVWYWGVNPSGFAIDMAEAGIKKALFSNVKDGADIQHISDLGFLTSRYDIYQDVWSPIYDDVTNRHEGWPEDLVLDKNGNWIKGWTIIKDGKEYPGGVVCSIPGLARAKEKIPLDLYDKPYTARFIDTTTCSPWRECYNPAHPTTRSKDVEYKMELLKFCSEEMGLVTGSENGVDCAVPYCDYFEGMMSIGIGRLPGSGRNVGAVTYMEPTENFLKYQVGEKYRIPLWGLVYGDCVVSTWYWGDSSNLIPEVWDRRDLFNILYGNMPLWAIRDWNHWKQYKNRFVESYKNVCPVFEKVGFEEMLSHKFVSDDQTVQETIFTGNIRIVVNFGDTDFVLREDNYVLPAKGFVVFEEGEVWKEGVSTTPTTTTTTRTTTSTTTTRTSSTTTTTTTSSTTSSTTTTTRTPTTTSTTRTTTTRTSTTTSSTSSTRTTTSTMTTTTTTTSTTTTTLPPKICRTCPRAFSVRQGSTICKSFRVWNCGNGTLNWTVSGGCNWLTLSTSNGTSTGEKDKITACVNTTGMAKGNYECTVTITGDGASNSPQTCVIRLRVK